MVDTVGVCRYFMTRVCLYVFSCCLCMRVHLCVHLLLCVCVCVYKKDSMMQHSNVNNHNRLALKRNKRVFNNWRKYRY